MVYNCLVWNSLAGKCNEDFIVCNHIYMDTFNLTEKNQFYENCSKSCSQQIER